MDDDDDIHPGDAITPGSSPHIEEVLKFPEISDDIKQLSHESIAPQNSYEIKPSFQDR